MAIGRLISSVVARLPLIGVDSTTRSRVLIHSGNRVLLQRDWLSSQLWTVAGGGLKRNETPAQSAQREVIEELQISLSESELTAHGSSQFAATGNTVFTAELFTAQVESSISFGAKWPEVIEAQWFEIDSLPQDREPVVDVLLTKL